MSFGKRLQEARLATRLPQSEIAAAAGVAQPTYSRWETEDGSMPAADKAFALARVLKVRVQWLVEGVPPMNGDVADFRIVDSLKTPALQELLRLTAVHLANLESELPAVLLSLLQTPTPETRNEFETKLRAVHAQFAGISHH